MITDWIGALANCVIALGVLMAWKQVKTMKEQNEAIAEQARNEHERSRREKAIDLFFEWSKTLNPKASSSRKFAELLSKEQSLSLLKQEEIEIDEKHKAILEACLNDADIEVVDKKIKLSKKQVSQIRWEVISYLNKLEAILSAWRHNVADKDIITEEFKYLIRPEDGHTLLEVFLSATNNSYPAIMEFAKHLNDSAKIKNGKEKVS